MSDTYAHVQPSTFFNSDDDNGIDDDRQLPFLASTSVPMLSSLAFLYDSAASAVAAASASSSSSALPPFDDGSSGAAAAAAAASAQPPQPPILDTWRVPPSLFTVFVTFYAAVFFCGLVGNTFVVAAIALNKTFRTATDWLISSLAVADLLILVFCLPSTLLNNLLTEWQLGSCGCKLSVWINSTTSCASIFTLVGVTGDRYLAICHPLRQLKMKNSLLHLYILGIWLLSALLASPNLWVYRQILYDLISGQQLTSDDPPLLNALSSSSSSSSTHNNMNMNRLVARLCVDTSNNIWLFIVINLLIAFLVPIVVICVLYTLIFRAISRHTRKKLAVDNGARIRDERVKLRIAQMMFTVIVVFVLCWTPLYALYCYFFMAEDRDSLFFQFASSVLRPIFQWLSLLSSSLNPLIYIAFSQKYRRAFHSLLLFPCRRRYKEFKQATRSTFRRSSCFSEKPSTVQLFMGQLGNNNFALRGEESVCANYAFSNSSNIHRNSADAALAHSSATARHHQQQQLRKVSFTTAIGGGGGVQQQSPAATAVATRRKLSEQQHQRHQSPLLINQQQRLGHGGDGWARRPLAPLLFASSSSSSCGAGGGAGGYASSLLTQSCDVASGSDSGDSSVTSSSNNNNSGAVAMTNLLRRVALENSQRQLWQQRQQISSASGDKRLRDDFDDNSDECCRNGAAGGDPTQWRCGDAERRRRQWREAMKSASPERRLATAAARDNNDAHASGSTENADSDDDEGGTARRRSHAASSQRTRSADPLLRAFSSNGEQQQQSLSDNDDDDKLLRQQRPQLAATTATRSGNGWR